MNLLLIGCGNIGHTLLNMWAQHKLFDSIVVVQPTMNAAEHHIKNKSIQFFKHIDLVPATFTADFTVLTLKPQKLGEVIPALSARSHKIVVSVLAGISIDRLTNGLVKGQEKSTKLVRMMPNIAIRTGHSVNLAFGSPNLSPEEILVVEKIFAPTGRITWLEDEDQIDILTPISGSGPAYFLLLAELLVDETIKLGIEPDVAHKLVQQTLIGTASLIQINTDYVGLIDSVTSKKGVTEAALHILRPNLQKILDRSIKAALLRIEELSCENSS